MFIDPSHLSPRERYRLLISTIVPRPIAFVSTISTGGKTNLAPYSFFNGVGGTPFSLLFCPSNRLDGEEKDTLRNAKPTAEGGTGEFVVNLAVESYKLDVAAAAEALPWGESEFDLTGLAEMPSRIVKPPRVAMSPVAFECRTTRVVRLAVGEPGAANIVIGEVVCVWAEEGVFDARFHANPERLATVGRMGGITYCSTRDRFDMPRGKEALKLKGGS